MILAQARINNCSLMVSSLHRRGHLSVHEQLLTNPHQVSNVSPQKIFSRSTLAIALQFFLIRRMTSLRKGSMAAHTQHARVAVVRNRERAMAKASIDADASPWSKVVNP